MHFPESSSSGFEKTGFLPKPFALREKLETCKLPKETGFADWKSEESRRFDTSLRFSGSKKALPSKGFSRLRLFTAKSVSIKAFSSSSKLLKKPEASSKNPNSELAMEAKRKEQNRNASKTSTEKMLPLGIMLCALHYY